MRNKKSILIATVLVLTSAGTVISCTHSSDTVVAKNVSFSRDITPIFTASCVINSSCHLGANGTNQNIDLDSAIAYATIISKNLVSVADPQSSLLYVEVNSGEMPKPPSAPLTASQQSLILEWIKEGALNN
jgi:hypothetical protein